MVKKILLVLFFAAVAFNFILASWYVWHDDIHFSSEIARDFFLFKEVDQKKIVLIGPSSSTGLFHGPLWSYVNYPAYKIGGGNPVVVGWFWVLLVVIFSTTNYFIGKKLFDKTTGYLFVLMTSLYMVFHVNGFYNPHGAMLLIPAFFFFFIRYFETLKLKYLLLHLLITGALIQFQMAVGIPFCILSFCAVLYRVIQKHKVKHILSYGLIGVLIANFLIFDLRHQFLISHLLFQFLSSSGRAHPQYLLLIQDRIWLLFSGTELLRVSQGRNLYLFLLLLALLIIQIKDKKFRHTYLFFLYFYVGFFALSILNTGGFLLYFYLFPLFPFVFLIFSSFATSRFKYAFVILFLIMYFLNLKTVLSDIQYTQLIIGKDIYSWKFLKNVATKIYSTKDKEFGYFVYSPNVVGYEGKYAMDYVGKSYPNKGSYFVKKPITYLMIAPPPQDNPFMRDEWWRTNQIRIAKTPTQTVHFDNGYKIERYELDEADIQTTFDPSIDPGLHFR